MFEIVSRESELNEGIVIVSVTGSLDAHNSPKLDKYFENLFNDKKYKIVLNMDKLDYMSSTGIGVIMGAIKFLEEHNGRIVCLKVPDKVTKVFEMLSFDSFLKMYKSKTMLII